LKKHNPWDYKIQVRTELSDDVHADVHGFHGVGEGSDADVVHAGGGHGFQAGKVHVAGGFSLSPPGIIILINVAYFPEKKFHF